MNKDRFADACRAATSLVKQVRAAIPFPDYTSALQGISRFT
jgi:hypothetical protein